MGERLKTAENPEDAVRQALSEELSVTHNDSLYTIGFNEKTSISETFPWVESTCTIYQYASIIPETAYILEEYIEYRTDKTNYYTRELMHTNSIS